MANYPTSASSDTNLYVAVNNKRTTLNGAINNSVTTVTVASTTGFPASGFISIDLEVIAYSGLNATQFTGCTRGADGTTAASHNDLASVILRVIAAHHNAPKDEIIAVETDLVAARGALNDVDTPASTATDIKDRLDHIVSELKRITQNTNWYDAVSVGLKDIAGNTSIGFGRNRLINGSFDIDQANGGSAVTINSAAQTYGPDMFLAEGQSADGVFTIQQLSATPPAGFNKYLRVAVTTADASVGASQIYGLQTRLEGYTIRDFDFGKSTAKSLTLSFWVRSSLTGTFGLGVLNNASSRSYVLNYTVNAANTWEYKTLPFTGDITGTWGTFTSAEMIIEWDIGTGTTFEAAAGSWNAAGRWRSSGNTRLISTNAATLDFTGIQLEIGTVATPFEFRPYASELRLCQRYYEKSYGRDVNPASNTATNQSTVVTSQFGTNSRLSQAIHFLIEKRALPTITLYPSDGSPSGSWTWMSTTGTQTERVTGTGSVGSYIHSFGVSQTVTNADEIAFGHWVADARL